LPERNPPRIMSPAESRSAIPSSHLFGFSESPSIELYFFVVESQISDALWIEKSNELTFPNNQPHYKVRMKISGLKEADAAAPTQIPQKIKLFVQKELRRSIVERPWRA
jgi:hypothetical protein